MDWGARSERRVGMGIEGFCDGRQLGHGEQGRRTYGHHLRCSHRVGGEERRDKDFVDVLADKPRSSEPLENVASERPGRRRESKSEEEVDSERSISHEALPGRDG